MQFFRKVMLVFKITFKVIQSGLFTTGKTCILDIQLWPLVTYERLVEKHMSITEIWSHMSWGCKTQGP